MLYRLLDELSGKLKLGLEVLPRLLFLDVYPEIQGEAQPPLHVVARDELVPPHGLSLAGVVVPPSTFHVLPRVVGDGVVDDEVTSSKSEFSEPFIHELVPLPIEFFLVPGRVGQEVVQGALVTAGEEAIVDPLHRAVWAHHQSRHILSEVPQLRLRKHIFKNRHAKTHHTWVADYGQHSTSPLGVVHPRPVSPQKRR